MFQVAIQGWYYVTNWFKFVTNQREWRIEFYSPSNFMRVLDVEQVCQPEDFVEQDKVYEIYRAKACVLIVRNFEASLRHAKQNVDQHLSPNLLCRSEIVEDLEVALLRRPHSGNSCSIK